jgi:inhibitor of cysteine peptidase
MRRLVTVSVLVAVGAMIAASALACASARGSSADPGDLSLDASYSGKKVEVKVGNVVAVNLDSNPSTGFRWELAGISDEQVLQLLGQEFRQAEAGQSEMVGAGGQEVWTFKAVGEGEAELSLEYSRPWPGGEKAVETFRATVSVK